jgi:lipopolysaccharide heptosyltransferase II
MAEPNVKILVFRLSAIGDIILASGLIRCLKEQLPGATVHFVVKKQFASLVSDNPNIDKVFPLDTSLGWAGLKILCKELKANCYDAMLDIHKNFRSVFTRTSAQPKKVYSFKKNILKRSLLTVAKIDLYGTAIPVYQRFILSAAKLGVTDDGKLTDFYINAKAAERMAGLLENNGLHAKQFVALCPGASFSNKQWPLERFIELVLMLSTDTSLRVAIIGGEKELSLGAELAACSKRVVNFAGVLSLQESAYLLSQACCTVANDTGMLHLSEAVKVPVVGIYGPTSEQLGYFPILGASKVAEVHGLKCRPCTKMGMDYCPQKHFNCMNKIEAREVFNLVATIIN